MSRPPATNSPDKNLSLREYAAAVVATWPPLTPEQIARLTALFGGGS